MSEAPLVELQDVTRRFMTGRRATLALDGVNLRLMPGETVGIVGESGSGKSILGRLIVGLDTPTSGQVFVGGADLAKAGAHQRRHLLHRIQMVFQDPYASLNPRMTVGRQVAEALLVQGMPASDIEAVVAELFDKVGLRTAQRHAYPHEFSGGQRQRIAIARALAPNPQLIVADEPVSALDVSVQAQILNLLVDVQRSTGVAYLFITHDIAVAAHVSRTICVVHSGRIVEQALSHEILGAARHPYTRALLDAVPRLGRRRSMGSSGPETWRAAVARPGGTMDAVSPTHTYLRVDQPGGSAGPAGIRKGVAR